MTSSESGATAGGPSPYGTVAGPGSLDAVGVYGTLSPAGDALGGMGGEGSRAGAGAGTSSSGSGGSGFTVRTPLGQRRWFRIIGGAILPLIILLVWQLLSTSGHFTIAQLPTPAAVFQAAVDLANRGLLGQYIAISVQRVIIGFLIGAALGLVLGAIVGLSQIWDVFFGTTLGAIRAVPSLAWVPLLILYLKIGEESKITLIAIGAFFPVYTTVAAALRHVDRQLVEAGRAFGLRGVRLLTVVQLPAVVPSVIAGLRLALAQSWLFLVAAELIASSMGLGFLLSDSGNNGRTDRLFLAIILLAVFGKTTDALIGLFQRWALKRWA